MGASNWSTSDFTSYTRAKGYKVSYDTSGIACTCLDGIDNASQMYTAEGLDSALNPKNVIRECRDSEEHPNTVSVILCLDETGSMSDCLMEVSSCLNKIISKLYETVTDLEICIMAIGDLAYDAGAIQIGQFESDIRIAEQLDKVWFERGGGGNNYESYTAAWYMGARHTDLDCWKRGKKGIIITFGDEAINPYLPQRSLEHMTGDSLQGDVETKDLYLETIPKYNLFHVFVDHNTYTHNRAEHDARSFADVIGENNVFIRSVNELSDTIINIVNKHVNEAVDSSDNLTLNTGGISW